MKLRTILLGLSALSIAGAAAFFSVTGLSKLFAGAALAVTIMAGTLEFGKLITASFLHEHWGKINTLLKQIRIQFALHISFPKILPKRSKKRVCAAFKDTFTQYQRSNL